MEGRLRLQRRSPPPIASIFCFTEAAPSASPSLQLPELLTSCNELQDTVAEATKDLTHDVSNALGNYNQARTVIRRPFVRKWRSQARYSDGRNRILTLLSTRNKSHDDHSQETFNSLLFSKLSHKDELSNQFKFTIPDILTPRMMRFVKTHRRPFGVSFASPVQAKQAPLQSSLNENGTIGDFLKSEIGKYRMDRMNRALRIPRRQGGRRGIIELKSSPSSPIQRAGSILVRARLPNEPEHFSHHPSPHHSRYLSDPLPDLEESLMLDVRKVRKDMAGVYRAEKLLAGSQVMELGRLKSFKAGLNNIREMKD